MLMLSTNTNYLRSCKWKLIKCLVRFFLGNFQEESQKSVTQGCLRLMSSSSEPVTLTQGSIATGQHNLDIQ